MASETERLRNRTNIGGMIGMGTALVGFGLIWAVIAIVRIVEAKPAGDTISNAVCSVVVFAAGFWVLKGSRTYVTADPAADDVVVVNGFRTIRVRWSQIAEVESEHGLRRRARLRLTDGSYVTMVALSSGLILPFSTKITRSDNRRAVCELMQQRLVARRAGPAGTAAVGVTTPTGANPAV